MTTDKTTPAVREPYDAMGPVDAPNPPAAHATLATVKHGGCVQLGASERARFEAWHCEKFKTRWQTGAPTRDLHNGVYADNYAIAEQQERWELWQAATAPLSAQPSPGGQGEKSAQTVWMLPDDARLVGVIADNIERGKLDHPGFYRNAQLAEVLRRLLTAALAARQPVGEVSVQKEDANNYCLILRALGMEEEGDPVAEVKALIDARDRQPVGQITDTEIDARLNALFREITRSGQHNGGMSGVAWDRAVYRMAASQPAQAVDLAPDHSGMRVDYHGLLGRSQEALRQRPELAEMLRQLHDHLTEIGRRWYAGDRKVVDEFLQLYAIEEGGRRALIDSQAVGNG